MKRTLQKEEIYRHLQNSTSHPTAEEVYSAVKKVLPHVGIATVYRNLRNLRANNEILCIQSNDGKEHFDANLTPHAHFTCEMCGKITDIFLTEAQINTLKEISRGDINLNYCGICPDCKNLISQKKINFNIKGEQLL